MRDTMSDLFLTSEGLELGALEEDQLNQMKVFVEEISGSLVKVTTGKNKCVRFMTQDSEGAFALVGTPIEEVRIQYGELNQVIRFSSYNYSIERSMDQTIVTIEEPN